MSDTHMVEYMLPKCPRCGSDGPERGISVHDPAKTFIHECSDCGLVSRLSVDTAIARWQSADEDNYREHMWR
jgi:hypothetical protein